MNLCYICSEYPPQPHGGIGSAVQMTGRALAARGHGVRVLGMKWDSALPDYEEDNGVQVHRLPFPKGPLTWATARFRLFRKVAEWARTREIDLVEIPDWEGQAAGWRSLPVPVVARLHGSLSYFASETKEAVKRIDFWLERSSVRRADFYSASSDYTARVTQKLFAAFNRAPVILYNFVDIPATAEPRERDPRKVLFAGTMTAKKGLIPLVRAWPIVLESVPGAELHIFGKDGKTEDGGSMQTRLEAMIQPRTRKMIHFHGHIDRERLRLEFQVCRLAVFPSYSEGFSLVPMEAMAEGCPVVFSRRSSGPELIQDGENGLLIEPDNLKELSDAIIQVLRNDALADRLGRCGRDSVLSRFSSSVMIPRYEDFYKHCVESF